MITVNDLKVEQFLFFNTGMCPKGADEMANSSDRDQTAPRSSLIWVWTVFSIAQTYLSQKLDIHGIICDMRSAKNRLEHMQIANSITRLYTCAAWKEYNVCKIN